MTKKIRSKILLSLLGLGLPIASFSQGNIPIDENAFNQNLQAQVFISKKEHQFIVKGNLEDNEVLSRNRSLGLGYRYKLNSRFKLVLSHGAFYGLRHNEDWFGLNGRWSWRDTKDRRESISQWGLQFKEPLNTKLVFKTKLLHLYNSFNDQQDVRLHTGLMYFPSAKWVNVAELRGNFPANYARQSVNYYSLYLASLYFLNRNFSLGPQLSYGYQRWTESIGFKMRTGDSYEVTNKVFFVGLIMSYYWDL